MTFFAVCVRLGGAFTQIFMTIDALSMKCIQAFSRRMAAFTIRLAGGYAIILMATNALLVEGLYTARHIFIINTGFMTVTAKLRFTTIFFIIIMVTVITCESIIIAVNFMVEIPVVPQRLYILTVYLVTRPAGARNIGITFFIGMMAFHAG